MKLFKKVMASVLAGVLALSMAACSTTAQTPAPAPGTPVTPAPATVDEQVVSLMNVHVKGHGLTEITTDAELNAKAATMLEAITGAGNTSYVAEGAVTLQFPIGSVNISANINWKNAIILGANVVESTYTNAFQNTPMPASVRFTDGTTLFSNFANATFVDRTTNAYGGLGVAIDQLVFKGTDAEKEALAALGTQIATQEMKVGVATAKFDTETVVVILTAQPLVIG